MHPITTRIARRAVIDRVRPVVKAFLFRLAAEEVYVLLPDEVLGRIQRMQTIVGRRCHEGRLGVLTELTE